MKLIKKLLTNSFFQGTIMLTIANFIVSLLNYFFNILIARSLGPQAFGDLTALFSYLTILSVPVTIVTTLVIQKISNAGDEKYAYARSLHTWLQQKLKHWWYIGAILICLSPFVSPLTNLSPIMGYSLILLLLVTFLISFYDAAFQGLHFFFLFTIISLTTAVVKLLGAVIVSRGIGDLSTVTLFIVVSFLFKYLASTYFFQTHTAQIKNIGQIDKRIISIIQNKSIWITSLSILGINMLNNADIIYAKKYFNPYDAGIYSSWSLFAKIVLYVTGPLLSMTLIFFADQNKERHKIVFRILVSLLLCVCIGGYLGYHFLGYLVVPLFFGTKFISIIPILGQAAIFGSLYLLIAFINQYLLAKQSKLAIIVPALLPLYIGYLFIVKPSIHGLIQTNIVFSFITLSTLIIFMMSRREAQMEKIRL